MPPPLLSAFSALTAPMGPLSGRSSPALGPDVQPLNKLVDKQPLMIGIIWSFGSLALISIVARLYVRLRIIKQTGRDDIAIFVCFFILLAMNILITISVHHGLGRHLDDFTLINASRADEFFDFALITSQLLLIMLKLSVLLMIERVFEVSLTKTLRFIFYFFIFLLTCLAIVQFTYIFTECTPTRAAWEPYLRHKHCYNRGASIEDIIEGFAAFSAFIDTLLAAFPVVQILKLRMPTKSKVIASILTGSGIIAAAFAIARGATLFQLDYVLDPLFGLSDLVVLSVLEIYFLVYASCAPSLGPLFRTDPTRPPNPEGVSWPSATDSSGQTGTTGKSASSRKSSRARLGLGTRIRFNRRAARQLDLRAVGEGEGGERAEQIDLEALGPVHVPPATRHGSMAEEWTVETEQLNRPFSALARGARGLRGPRGYVAVESTRTSDSL